MSSTVDLSEPWHRPGPTYGDPRLVPQRLGQGSFQAVVLQAYGRRCAITGAKIRPVLQAAHIRPLSKGGEHRLDNGLLLRSDMHTLYDGGYIGVDPKHRLVVSPRLREEFHNGDDLYARSGTQISLPERRPDRPSREFLEWHLDEVFLARRSLGAATATLPPMGSQASYLLVSASARHWRGSCARRGWPSRRGGALR